MNFLHSVARIKSQELTMIESMVAFSMFLSAFFQCISFQRHVHQLFVQLKPHLYLGGRGGGAILLISAVNSGFREDI